MSDNQLQVFISWSQEPAKQIAKCVRGLLEKIFPDPNIEFFLSSDDISAGENFVDILDEYLAASCFGILILTKNNFAKEWLMYEAGALAKGTKEKGTTKVKTKPKLCPILFTREKEKIESPLKKFQHTIFEEASFLTLICSIKQSIFKVKSLEEKLIVRLTDDLNKEWNNFEQEVKKIIQEHPDNYHDANITGLTPGSVGELMMDGEAYEQIFSERQTHLKELINKLPTDDSKRIIIFGGFSSELRKHSAIIELAVWVVRNQTSKLFICHENATVAKERAKDLPLDIYDKNTSSDEEAISRTVDERDEEEINRKVNERDNEAINRKVDKVKRVRDILLSNIGKDLHKNVNFIEITKPTNLYATIQGDIMYLTPLLDKRSSDTFTIKLKDTKYIEQILSYLRSIKSENKENGHSLVKEIDLIIENRNTNKEGERKHGK